MDNQDNQDKYERQPSPNWRDTGTNFELVVRCSLKGKTDRSTVSLSFNLLWSNLFTQLHVVRFVRFRSVLNVALCSLGGPLDPVLLYCHS